MSAISSPNERVEVEWDFHMTPTTQKLLRGLIFALVMGVVTLVVVVEGGDANVFLGALFILASLLVFGIDIKHIELGPMSVEFESHAEELNRESERDALTSDEWMGEE